ANEEVVDGKSEVGSHPVERRNLRQVVLRITAYAEKLLNGLEGLKWPDSTKRMQTAWIGRSEGAEIDFVIDQHPGEKLRIFTTRPDTLFGATYMVIAPEHPLVEKLCTGERRDAVKAYQDAASKKSDLDRTDLAKEKSGEFTGAYALNPVNGARIPIWIADYVLISYGTGAIMAVPAHDERDFEFAEQFSLPIIPVVEPKPQKPSVDNRQLPYSGRGILINSDDYTGLTSDDAKQKIVADLAQKGSAEATVNFKLRDWIFSRQRYWGEPIPMVWVSRPDFDRALNTPDSALHAYLPKQAVTSIVDDETKYALPVLPEHLPLNLPETESYQPSGTGESPLATIDSWLRVKINLKTGAILPETDPSANAPDWVSAVRETNTMPQWAGSCWYHLRYMDPKNPDALVGKEAERIWQTPDIYIGGAEHAVLHLLYARFWHHFLFDIGVLSQPEPYKRLFHQGIILGEDGQKMSKSRGNVVNPDDIVRDFGADALRLYEMFLGPLEAMKPWSTQSIQGMVRFLKKVWTEIIDTETGQVKAKISDSAQTDPETAKILHQTIKTVTEDIEGLRFNTAISQLMVCINRFQKAEGYTTPDAECFVQLLAPFAPHICEELWERLGNQPSVSKAKWPKFDPSKLVEDSMKIVFQVNGKTRNVVSVSKEITKETILDMAKNDPKILPHLSGQTIKREIYVPGKLVNLVAN
ncbi:MAG: class I tRNA ligase family protein, partial [Verrucomicrobiota bacterium]